MSDCDQYQDNGLNEHDNLIMGIRIILLLSQLIVKQKYILIPVGLLICSNDF
jgi:hypothetical protein